MAKRKKKRAKFIASKTPWKSIGEVLGGMFVGWDVGKPTKPPGAAAFESIQAFKKAFNKKLIAEQAGKHPFYQPGVHAAHFDGEKFVPLALCNHNIRLNIEVFDQGTLRGYKLNLITGKYHKP